MWTNKSYIIDLSDKKISSLCFCGDIHGAFDSLLFSLKSQKRPVVGIACGDIGFGFCKSEYYLQKFNAYEKALSKLGSYVVLVRGNHDDPDYFNHTDKILPELAEEGKYPHVIIARDYQTVKTSLGNILCIGGARSIDKVLRKPGLTWWEGEDISPFSEKIEKMISSLPFNIDIVASHTAPDFCMPKDKSQLIAWLGYDPDVLADCDKERVEMTRAFNIIASAHKVKWWFYGHFHERFETLEKAPAKDIEPTKFVGLDMCRHGACDTFKISEDERQ